MLHRRDTRNDWRFCKLATKTKARPTPFSECIPTYLPSSSIQVPDVKWASRVPRETYLLGDYSLVLIKASFVVGLVDFRWQFWFWTKVLETLDFIPDEWTIIFDKDIGSFRRRGNVKINDRNIFLKNEKLIIILEWKTY